uniref:Uncharacterized protein n=1 Tax=Arundo donax TaxID=35708 RepID=A0A0A8ZFF0_ARUDO
MNAQLHTYYMIKSQLNLISIANLVHVSLSLLKAYEFPL